MKKMFLFFGILILLINFNLISAGFAISSGYNRGAPLVMALGETREIQFGRLQNPEEKDKIYEIELVGGGEIADLIDDDLDLFVVPAGTIDTAVNLRISIPEGAVEGNEYIISIKFSDIIPSDDEGMVTFVTSTTKSMPVLIDSLRKEKEIGEIVWVWGVKSVWIMVGVLVFLIVIIIFAIRYFLKKKRQRIIAEIRG